MRFCTGIFAKILSLCLTKGTSRKAMVEALVKAVDPDSCYDIDSTTVNRLLNCTNASKAGNNRTGKTSKRFVDVITVAQKASLQAVTNEFNDSVCELIIEDKKDLLISVLLGTVEKDVVIESDLAKSFEKYVGKTKEMLLAEADYDLPELLAGLFLYSLSAVENSVGRGCDKKNKDCAVSEAVTVAYQHKNKNGETKDEHKQAVSAAIKDCGNDCVLCITEDYLSSFSGTKRKQRLLAIRDYIEKTKFEIAEDMALDIVTTIVLSNEQHDCCLKCHKKFETITSNGITSKVISVCLTSSGGSRFLLCPSCKMKVNIANEEEINALLEIKRQYLETERLIDNAQGYVGQEEIEKLMRELSVLIERAETDSDLLKPLNDIINADTTGETDTESGPAKPSDKIPNSPLLAQVTGLVNYCYGGVNDIIERIKDENISKADNIRPCIHQAYVNLRGTGRTQSQIFDNLVEVLKKLTGSRYSPDSYKTVVAYFVPQCSVFERMDGRKQ